MGGCLQDNWSGAISQGIGPVIIQFGGFQIQQPMRESAFSIGPPVGWYLPFPRPRTYPMEEQIPGLTFLHQHPDNQLIMQNTTSIGLGEPAFFVPGDRSLRMKLSSWEPGTYLLQLGTARSRQLIWRVFKGTSIRARDTIKLYNSKTASLP